MLQFRQTVLPENGDKPEEEFFIAALLYHLGEIAFWFLADEDAEKLLAAGQSEDISKPEVQRKILGFTFSELTAQLTKNWNLSDLLYNALTDEKKIHQNHALFI